MAACNHCGGYDYCASDCPGRCENSENCEICNPQIVDCTHSWERDGYREICNKCGATREKNK